MKRKALLNKKLKEFASVFEENGYLCFLVGGALRNYYAGIEPSDFDFATDATPEDIIRIFRHVIPTGIKHGTVTVLYKGAQYEVTTFRIESTYSNARHPDSVSYSSSIYEDLKRRDFTMNAIALDMNSGELIDPHEGIKDIKKELIRAIGNPEERFSEDGLRLMRACRFTSQLGFTIEENTLSAMEKTAKNILNVSMERIRDEIIRILGTDKPSRAFKIMERTGIMRYILPEFLECRGVEQKGFHDFDVLDHLYYSCDGARGADITVQLAALLHDLGKPGTLSMDNSGVNTFYNHDALSAELCGKILRRLKFPNNIIKKTCHLVRNHMFNYTEEWSDSAIRRFIARVGIDNIDDLFKLRMADQYGMKNRYADSTNLRIFAERIKSFLNKENAYSVKDLAVDGKILQEELNIKQGPLIGKILSELLETVLDDPSLNTKDRLLKIAENFLKNNLTVK